MDELVEWLRTQFDEDERIARENSDGRGLAEGFPDYRTYSDDDTAAADEYIEYFSPARMLRETDARRKMIGRINSHAAVMGWDEVHTDLLRLLALPYVDRPGYREGWRP